MRQELINLFDGKTPEIPKARVGLLRTMRRQPNGIDLIPCDCNDIITKEGSKDYFCPICLSEGFQWDEHFIQFYRIIVGRDVRHALGDSLADPGLINVPLEVFYIRYDTTISRGDKIAELVLDLEGNPVQPMQRWKMYRFTEVYDYRLDHAKMEYWKAFAYREFVKYLNVPTYEAL
jgi:hypothetical protein